MENYQVLRKIGSGNFAKVYLAVHTPTRKQVGDPLNQPELETAIDLTQLVCKPENTNSPISLPLSLCYRWP